MNELSIAPGARSGFLTAAIQRAIDLKIVSDTWLEQYTKEAERRADMLAEKKTQFLSPTVNEFRGARFRIRQYLAFAVEERSRGNLDHAARCLSEVPMKELLLEGVHHLRQLRGSLDVVIDRYNNHGESASLEAALSLVTIQRTIHASLEELGESEPDPKEAETQARHLIFIKYEFELGDLLIRTFHKFHVAHIGCTYGQYIHNLAVSLTLRDEMNVDVSLFDIRKFVRQMFVDSKIDEVVASQVLGKLTWHLQHLGASPGVIHWFKLLGWPAYVQEMYQFASRAPELSVQRCQLERVFLPTGKMGPRKSILTGLRATDDMLRQLSSQPLTTQVERLNELGIWDVDFYLQYLSADNPTMAMAILNELPPKISMRILRIHEVELEDFDYPERSESPWISEYLRQLAKNPKHRDRLKATFSQVKKPDMI